MKNLALHARTPDSHRPNPLVTFRPVYAEGKHWQPNPGDRHTLLLLRRVMPTKVSFRRAYRGWRASGASEEKELGEGRAFLRWLQRHEISIEWSEDDFTLHPLFTHKDSPRHDLYDEMAENLSFAVKPVYVENRKIKLYIQDPDMLGLIGLPYGDEEDFLNLVSRYVAKRFQWESWRAPAPTFLNWVISQGQRPIFKLGQLGFRPVIPMR